MKFQKNIKSFRANDLENTKINPKIRIVKMDVA